MSAFFKKLGNGLLVLTLVALLAPSAVTAVAVPVAPAAEQALPAALTQAAAQSILAVSPQLPKTDENRSSGIGLRPFATEPVATEQALLTALANFDIDTINLTADITLTGTTTLTITGGRVVTLTGDFDLIGVDGRDTVLVSTGTLILNGPHITHATGASDGSGGVTVETSGVLKLMGGSISNNNKTKGAGVYNGGVFVMSGGKISDNTAGISGGDGSGIYNDGDGGGVYNSGDFTMSDGIISHNTAATYGAGVYSSGTFAMSGGQILQNTAGGYNGFGGGVYNRGSFSISNGAISDNKAGTSNGYGGGIYSASSLTVAGGTISDNSAAVNGGGIYIANEGLRIFKLENGTISGNSAKEGAGIYSNTAFTMTDGMISGNIAASRGGGVYHSASFTMKGGEISDNKAAISGGYGGGVYSNSAFIMEGGKISGNIAGTAGGGIGGGVFLSTSGSLTMKNGEIINNTAGTAASGNGGGIYCNGVITMEGGTISDNSAFFDGGGIYLNAASLTMRNGSISNNRAGRYGGGIHVASSTSSITLSGGEVSNNTTTTNIGSGLYWIGGSIRVSGAPKIGTANDGNAITRTSGAQVITILTAGFTSGAYINIDPWIGTNPDAAGKIIATRQTGSATEADAGYFHYLGSFVTLPSGANVILGAAYTIKIEYYNVDISETALGTEIIQQVNEGSNILDNIKNSLGDAWENLYRDANYYLAGELDSSTPLDPGDTLTQDMTYKVVYPLDSSVLGPHDIIIFYYNDSILGDKVGEEHISDGKSGDVILDLIIDQLGADWLDLHRGAGYGPGLLDSSSPLSSTETLSQVVILSVVYSPVTIAETGDTIMLAPAMLMSLSALLAIGAFLCRKRREDKAL